MLFEPLCAAKRVVCVGDLHGNLKEAQSLWKHLIRKFGGEVLKRETAIVFLGDLCDRGPSTRQLLDWIIMLQTEYPLVFCLSGNHDFGMASFLGCVPSNPSDLSSDLTLDGTRKLEWTTGFWPHSIDGGMHYQGRRWGGTHIYNADSTFRSYGVDGFESNLADKCDAFVAAVPEAHKQLLASMRWVIEVECARPDGPPIKITCVHAGLCPEKDAATQLQALRAKEWRHPVLHDNGTVSRIKALSGRRSVLDNHPELVQNDVVLVSGHHGLSRIDRHRLRAIVDEHGGRPGQPVQAIVFPEWLVLDSSGVEHAN